MIRLQKGPRPQILEDNATVWTDEIKRARAQGNDPTPAQKTRYNRPEIKAAVKAETHSKCAYCESHFAHVTPGDIEHIIPKSRDPDLMFIWENLTIACDWCNTNKGDREGLIDPYNEDPEAHFIFEGPLMFALPNNSKAQLTHLTLKLNRPDLLDRRIERITELWRRVIAIHQTQDPTIRTLLLGELVGDETADQKAYAACARAFVAGKTASGLLP